MSEFRDYPPDNKDGKHELHFEKVFVNEWAEKFLEGKHYFFQKYKLQNFFVKTKESVISQQVN